MAVGAVAGVALGLGLFSSPAAPTHGSWTYHSSIETYGGSDRYYARVDATRHFDYAYVKVQGWTDLSITGFIGARGAFCDMWLACKDVRTSTMTIRSGQVLDFVGCAKGGSHMLSGGPPLEIACATLSEHFHRATTK